MKIGVDLPATIPNVAPDLLLEWARRADSGPFSSIGMGERLNYASHDCIVALSAVAAVTSRARLLTAILIVPVHNEVLLAKQLASLDVLSGGRLDIGVAVGGRKEEYLSTNQPFANRHARLGQNVEAMRSIWSGQAPRSRVAAIGPTPAQVRGPRIIAAVSSLAAIRQAAYWADGIFPWSFGPDHRDVGRLYEAADSAWKIAGREVRPIFYIGFYVAFGEKVRERSSTFLLDYYEHLGTKRSHTIVNAFSSVCEESFRRDLQSCKEMGVDEVIVSLPVPELEQLDRAASVANAFLS